MSGLNQILQKAVQDIDGQDNKYNILEADEREDEGVNKDGATASRHIPVKEEQKCRL